MSRGDLSFREVITVSRPLWWVVTCTPFIVGSLLAKDELSAILIIGALYFLLPYNLLVYGLNDIFDYESDIRNLRKNRGTIISKLKHPALWRWIAILNIPCVIYLWIVGNLESNVFLFMMVYMAFAYSVAGLRYKEIPVIGSLTSAFHYGSPFLFALFLFESPELYAPAFAGFYFWAVGNHAFGAIQDIVPDRESGTKTIATSLGIRKTVWFVLISYGLAILAPVLGYGFYGLAAAAAIGPYLLVVLSASKHRDHESAPRFRKAWKTIVLLNYLVGITGTLAVIYLYNR